MMMMQVFYSAFVVLFYKFLFLFILFYLSWVDIVYRLLKGFTFKVSRFKKEFLLEKSE